MAMVESVAPEEPCAYAGPAPLSKALTDMKVVKAAMIAIKTVISHCDVSDRLGLRPGVGKSDSYLDNWRAQRSLWYGGDFPRLKLLVFDSVLYHGIFGIGFMDGYNL